MSLGFLTESALMPSISKPIQVDSRSQIALKAIVAEELSKKEAKESLRGSRGKKRAIEERRKDVYAGRNKGVEERKKQDQVIQDQEDAHDKREFTYMTVLKKKVEEYDRMAEGGQDADSGDEDCLVDFSKKRRSGESGLSARRGEQERGKTIGKQALATEDWGDMGAGEVEITDEFGRTRRVSKKSEEYKQYKDEHQAQRQHDAFFRKKDSSSSSHRAAGEGGMSSMARRGGGQEGDEGEREEQQGPWSWSRGDEGSKEKREERRRKKKDMAAAEAAELPKTSADGSILTQWERKLQSQAREYLQEVISEEASKTGEAADIYQQKQREKEERRAKLRQKLRGSS